MSTVIESLLVGLGFDADTSGASKFTGAMDGVVGKAMAAAAVIGSIFTANGFIETASQFEQFEVQLATLLRSSEKAKESLDWISKFAAKTPYEMQGVTDAFVKLTAYGFDPKNGLLESLGNAASGLGKDLMVGVEAIADSINGENERLKEAFNIKAKVKGASTEYMYTSLLDGRQKIKKVMTGNKEEIEKAIREILDENFRGGMVAMSKTWEGLLSNMSDTWDMFKRKVMDNGVFDALKGRLNRVMVWFADNSKEIDEWATSLGEGITYAMDRVEGIGNAVRKWADDMGITEKAVTLLKAAVGYLGVALAGLAVGGTIKAAISTISLLLSPMMLIGAAIGVLMLAIDDFMTYQEGGDSIIGRLIKQYPALEGVISAVKNFVGIIANLFSENSEGFGELGTAFSGLFNAIQPVIAAIISMLPTFINLIGFAINWLVSGTGESVGILTTLVNIIGFLIDRFVALGQWIGETIGAGVMWFDRILNAIKNVGIWFDKLVQKFSLGLPELELPSLNLPAFTMPSMPSMGDLKAKLGIGSDGGKGTTTVHQNVNVTVPTGAAAGAAVREMGNSAAKNTASKSKSAVYQ